MKKDINRKRLEKSQNTKRKKKNNHENMKRLALLTKLESILKGN